MKNYIVVLAILFLFSRCKNETQNQEIVQDRNIPHNYTSVAVEVILKDSTSIRAVEVIPDGVLYAGSSGKYGYAALGGNKKSKEDYGAPVPNFEGGTGTINFNGELLAFRSIASTTNFYFVLSIESPALLYRIHKETGAVTLVYQENHEKAFCDSMAFWNDDEGIAMGDPTDGCLSIITTRDGGATWTKISCDNLPITKDGEAAFAASDTNIKIIGNDTWIISGGIQSRVFYSSDKGKTWEVSDLPIVQGTATQGAYSLDFYDQKVGLAYGGDYTTPEINENNIVRTIDGGKTWQIVGAGKNQGYKSCVQFIPGSNGREIVALGFTGISYSKNGGETWSEISKESFLSFRFLNDSVAYAGGRNRFARLTFR